MNFPSAARDLVDSSAGLPPRANRRMVILLALLLAVATAALYAPALNNGFVNFDDPDYVTRNAHVLRGITWQNTAWAFTTDNPAANWHPLTWLSHMLDVACYGTNPKGHHLTNVLLHVADVMILFLLLESATGLALRSAAVAALFALHPLNVESVAWVSERKAVLCLFFLLLALAAYGWYVRKPGLGRYCTVLLFFAMGLMSKIMVITFPFGLLLLDSWPLGRVPGADKPEEHHFWRALSLLIIEKIPLFLLALAGGWITLCVQKTKGAAGGAMPLAWRLKNVVYSYAAYLGKALWPTRLAVFYPHPENSLPRWKLIGAALVLVGVSMVVWHFRKKSYLLVGWLWYLGTMVPMIGLVQSGRQGMADRFMYIPLLGLLIALVWGIADWADPLKLRQGLATVAFLAVVCAYVYWTRTQIGYWKNSYTLFAHALNVTTNNAVAENNLGSAFVEMGQAQLAESHFEAAVRLTPSLASAHYNLGVLLQRRQQLPEAAKQYRLAIANATDVAEAAQAHNNLGILYLESKDFPAASRELSVAIALNPEEQNSYIGRATIELQAGNYDGAIVDFARAAQIAPSPTACYGLGRALESKGDYARATSAYAAALQLAPGMAEARTRLQALQSKTGERR